MIDLVTVWTLCTPRIWPGPSHHWCKLWPPGSECWWVGRMRRETPRLVGNLGDGHLLIRYVTKAFRNRLPLYSGSSSCFWYSMVQRNTSSFGISKSASRYALEMSLWLPESRAEGLVLDIPGYFQTLFRSDAVTRGTSTVTAWRWSDDSMPRSSIAPKLSNGPESMVFNTTNFATNSWIVCTLIILQWYCNPRVPLWRARTDISCC